MLGDKRLGDCPRLLGEEVNVILSGRVGVGKTTICEKILTLAGESGYCCGGVLTSKITNDGAVAGIAIIDIQTGEKETLASIENIYDGPHTGRFYFNPVGIEFGKKAIKNGASGDILCRGGRDYSP